MSDPLIEQIVESARVKWPTAKWIEIKGGSWLWCATDNKTDSYKATIEVETDEAVYADAARTLPALLEKLRGADDA